jgi:RNA polymerase sigma-70 factor (ECF subfamily)
MNGARAVSVTARGTDGMPASQQSASPPQTQAAVESRAWLERLRADGPERDQALADLRELLLKAARFEVHRRGSARGEEEDLAQQSADDALLAILGKLDDFRGESRFTTWAYKFALLEAAVKVRRRTWQGREIPLEAQDWALVADQRSAPDRDAEAGEVMNALQRAIKRDLTPHQREVLVAIALNDVPIDVLAERLSTTRGALYKTLHDARRKLRSVLAQDGFPIEAI